MFDVRVCISLAKVAWKGEWFAVQVLCDYCEEHGLPRKVVKEMRRNGRQDCRKLLISSRKLFCTFISSRRSTHRLVRWMNTHGLPLTHILQLRRLLTWEEGMELWDKST